jgi:hypothetical protein
MMKFSTVSFMTFFVGVSAFAPHEQQSLRSGTQLFASQRKPFITGNWKLNPTSREEAVKLATGIANAVTSNSPDADVALFVPYPFIEAVKQAVGDRMEVGAEVSSW